jgi:hypothetical protein
MEPSNPINADTSNDGPAAKDRSTLLRFTYASITLSLTIIILLMALRDFGRSSILVAPITAFLTIVYHATILIIARRHPPTSARTTSPATTKVSVVLAFILTFLWFFASTLTNLRGVWRLGGGTTGLAVAEHSICGHVCYRRLGGWGEACNAG